MDARKKKVRFKTLFALLIIIAFCIVWVIFTRSGEHISTIRRQTFTIRGNSSYSAPIFILNGSEYIDLDTLNSLTSENIQVKSTDLDKRLGILYWKENSNLMEFRNFIFPDYIYSLKDYPDNKYVVRQSLLIGFKSIYVKSDINFNLLSANNIKTVIVNVDGKDYICSDKKVINDFLTETSLDYKNIVAEKIDYFDKKISYITISFTFENFPASYNVCDIYEDENGCMRVIDSENGMTYPVSDHLKNIVNNYMNI